MFRFNENDIEESEITENIHKVFFILTIALFILVTGIQIGIYHGKELARQEQPNCTMAN